MDSEVKALILKRLNWRYQAYMDSLSARANFEVIFQVIMLF